jgi:hypothetical protein
MGTLFRGTQPINLFMGTHNSSHNYFTGVLKPFSFSGVLKPEYFSWVLLKLYYFSWDLNL